MYKGMLAIPYLRPSWDGQEFVCSIRFRCLEPHEEHLGHGKYNTMPGDRPRMYNTDALVRSNDTIAICEGEVDTITAELCGIPAVGIPGIQLWKRDFRAPFLGYETVYVLSDGDEAGRTLATTIAKELTNVKQIPMPPGMDVNDVVLKYGAGSILDRIN